MLNLYYHKTKYVSVGTLLYRSIRFGILVSNVISNSKKKLKWYIHIRAKYFFFQMIIGGKQHELDQITDKNYFSQSYQRDTNELYI